MVGDWSAGPRRFRRRDSGARQHARASDIPACVSTSFCFLPICPCLPLQAPQHGNSSCSSGAIACGCCIDSTISIGLAAQRRGRGQAVLSSISPLLVGKHILSGIYNLTNRVGPYKSDLLPSQDISQTMQTTVTFLPESIGCEPVKHFSQIPAR